MNFLDYGADESKYKHIHQTILDGNVMNIFLIIMEINYGAINYHGSTFHGYYIIRFSSSSYILQIDLSMDGQDISSDEMECEGTFFSIIINSHYYVSLKNKSNNTIVLF